MSSDKALRLGRSAFFVSALLTLSSAVLLLGLILTHQFQYSYVWNFSSRDLPFPLLVSTFYAGQEGSFHLWALYTAIVGVILVGFTRPRDYEGRTMAVYASILASLQLMLVVKNPYALLSDTMTVLGDKIPLDGRGLNPLLQNYWMVIHPPILFLGFTIMAVPFALAIAAMLQKDFGRWITLSLPWLNFGAMVLGLGIILGAFWAYETLGWGGYWAWDPVENSSLIPWLVCIAATHSSLVQRRNGGLVRTNFVLSLLPFILVLYSTFLTRSGVLGDTSVHSFVEPGMLLYWLLLGMVLLAILGSALVYGMRRKKMVQPIVNYAITSRELMLYLGSIALLFVAIFVTAGTSAPLITGLIQGEPSAVDASYYVVTSLPLTAAILFLSGLGQLLVWGPTPGKTAFRKIMSSAILSLAATIALGLIGMHHAGMLLLVFAATFGLAVNLQIGIQKYMKKLRVTASAAAHIGLAVLVLGIIASAKYDQKSIVAMEQGQPQHLFGYDFTYIGYNAQDRGRFAFVVRVKHDGTTSTIAPVMFENSQNGELMRTPDILSMLTNLCGSFESGHVWRPAGYIFVTYSGEVRGV
ncbi:MAG: cytochrome c biogenesis protein CcsA [Ignavibacteriales bacterium]|nr:cytochrome c biogenesis protein CcsA [Ignavibacteriales bacterium]